VPSKVLPVLQKTIIKKAKGEPRTKHRVQEYYIQFQTEKEAELVIPQRAAVSWSHKSNAEK